MLRFWLLDGGELRHSSRQGWTPTPTLRIAYAGDAMSTTRGRKDARWPRVPDTVRDARRLGGVIDSYHDLISQTEEIADGRIGRRGGTGTGPQLR